MLINLLQFPTTITIEFRDYYLSRTVNYGYRQIIELKRIRQTCKKRVKIWLYTSLSVVYSLQMFT